MEESGKGGHRPKRTLPGGEAGQDACALPARRRRARPKRLRVDPPDPRSPDGGDAYEFDPEDILASTWVRRPLPSMASMASLAEVKSSGGRNGGGTEEEETMPLLRHFVASLVAAGGDGDGDGEARSAPGELDAADASGDGTGAGDEDGGLLEARRSPFLPAKAAASGAGEASAVSVAAIEPLEDPSLSTLTDGQRSRYEHSVSKGRPPLPTDMTPKGREYRALRDAVREERRRYCAALRDFREKNSARFLIGFKIPGPASNFVHTGSELVAQWRKRWLNPRSGDIRPAVRYERCSQAISLHSFLSPIGENEVAPPKKDFASGRKEASDPAFDVQSFSPRVVYSSASKGRVSRAGEGWMDSLAESSPLRHPTRDIAITATTTTLLCEDQTAISLATEHGADVLLTFEAFEALLRRPGYESTRWKIPVFCNGSQSVQPVIMEDPLPVQCTTREWLTKGFAAGLTEVIHSSSTCAGGESELGDNATPDDMAVQYTYTLLSFPSTFKLQPLLQRGRRRPLVVLVRTANTLLDERGCPLRIRTSLEYFPERGREAPTPHERAAWILERMIQKSCRLVVARVDPQTATVLGVEERGVAHALAADFCGNMSSGASSGNVLAAAFDPLPHFEAAATVLCTVWRIGQDNSHRGTQRGHWLVLCLPGRGVPPSSTPQASVSVHGEEHTREVGEAMGEEDCIDIEHELSAADAVTTSQQSLMMCFRPWEWAAERLPFTFPTKG